MGRIGRDRANYEKKASRSRLLQFCRYNDLFTIDTAFGNKIVSEYDIYMRVRPPALLIMSL